MKSVLLYLMGLAIGVAVHAASLVDTTFNPGSGSGGGIVEQVLLQPDGKILICGNFTSFNGQNRGYVARLNSDGSVDPSFLAQPGYWVRNMALQADGKIVIGGYFTTVQGVPRNLVARLNSDGSLDTSFDPGTGARDIIAGGIDGNIDPFVFWVAVQPDQKIIITGNFRNYNGAPSVGIVRINPDGSRDPSFNVAGGLDSWGRHVRVLANGQILLSGWFTQYHNQGFNRLVRINPDGSPDNTFNPYFGDKTAIYSTVVQPDGKVVATGHSLNEQGLFRREMERLNPDGSMDQSFVGFTNEKTESVLLQPDGKVIVAGNFSQANNVPRTCLARFFPDGALDPDFSANIDNFVWGTALQPDGKLLISGGFYTVDGFARSGVARLNTGLSGGGTTGGGGNPPPDTAPTLSVSAVSANAITLGWSDSSTIRTGYNIEQKDSTGTYVQVGTAAAASRSFTVGGLAPSTAYSFRIRANNNTGTSIYSNESGAATSAVTGGGANRATFVASDGGTRGTWKGAYGAEGYAVFGDTSSYPSYVTVTPLGKSDWTWQWSTQDAAAVQRPTGTDRLAACWYSPSGYSIDFRFNDTAVHRVAIYFLDWDLAGRREGVTVSDSDTGAILDGRTISSFGSGVYLIWDLAGHVKVTISPQSGNGVASAIFFGGSGGGGTTPTAATPTIAPNGGSFTSAQQVTLSTSTAGAAIRYTLDGTDPTTASPLYSSPFSLGSSATVKAKAFAAGYLPSATASAAFTITTGGGTTGGGTAGGTGANKFAYLGSDSSTQGNWRGAYGSDGYHVIAKSSSYPAYAQVVPAGKQDWIWNDTTSDPRALQTPDGSSRIASCWYGDSFTVDINLTDGRTHRLALYVVDWDFNSRSQTVELLDGDTGTVLQSQTVSGFSGGQYLKWDLKGHLKLRFTKLSGFNAVVNGLFFQPAPAEL